MKRAYYLTKDTYNKKSISINAKLRHYATVVRSEALYGAECLTLNKEMMMEEFAIAERRILRKILGPIKEGDPEFASRSLHVGFEVDETGSG